MYDIKLPSPPGTSQHGGGWYSPGWLSFLFSVPHALSLSSKALPSTNLPLHYACSGVCNTPKKPTYPSLAQATSWPRTSLALPLAPQIPHQPYNHPQLLCNLSPTYRKQEVGAESRRHLTPALTGPPPVPQFPLSQYLTWPVLPKCCGPLGTPGPASLSCPCPGTTCAGPLGGRPGRVSEPPGCELPATWRRSPGIGRPGRTPGQLWSPGVCFLPSLPSLLCVCFPQLPHGRHPPFLAACSQGRDPRPHPGVAAPAQASSSL